MLLGSRLLLARRCSGNTSRLRVMANAPGQSGTSPQLMMVYVTVPEEKSGRSIAEAVVREGLAACVNIVPGLESVYTWQGKVESDKELLLLMKTRESLLDLLTSRVTSLHPYDTCEVLGVPVIGGSEPYLQWVRDSTAAAAGKAS